MEKWTSIEIQGERKRIAFFLERNDELCVEDRELLAAFNTIDEKQDEIERLQSELKELKEKQRWIPVTERLPEEGKEVWAALKDGTAMHNNKTWYRMLRYSSSFGWSLYTSEVTHWMALPELPKEEE